MNNSIMPIMYIYHWFDEKGKITIYPIESKEYQKFVTDPAIKKLEGMKSKL